MNISVHIPEHLVNRLNDYLNNRTDKPSKNSILVTALEQFLDNEEEKDSGRGKEIMEWQGCPEFTLERDNSPWREVL